MKDSIVKIYRDKITNDIVLTANVNHIFGGCDCCKVFRDDDLIDLGREFKCVVDEEQGFKFIEITNER